MEPARYEDVLEWKGRFYRIGGRASPYPLRGGKAVEECGGRQRETRQKVSALENCAVAELQGKYGAELFEQYQREHGAEQTARAAGQTITQEVGKSR